ncbi:hypothetical protein [Arthrobacter celericrescens]|uniref:hypothetical protein n=1 Tax=Arthrobacter celericrescens TaxID=2320851 RepID=UPI000EA0601F|nr:hypothetical protein [Arthrobacter celericrescens]
MTTIFEVDSDFILSEQIPLVAGDLRYGLDRFFINDQTVIDIAVGAVGRGSADPLLHELAALLPTAPGIGPTPSALPEVTA